MTAVVALILSVSNQIHWKHFLFFFTTDGFGFLQHYYSVYDTTNSRVDLATTPRRPLKPISVNFISAEVSLYMVSMFFVTLVLVSRRYVFSLLEPLKYVYGGIYSLALMH